MIYLYYFVLLAMFYIIMRKRIEVIFPLVMIRSKRFTQEIYSIGKKYQKYLSVIFAIGIAVGILLMVYSTYYLVQGVVSIQTETAPRLGIILPGTEFGGIKLPVIQGLIALIIIVTAHELGHGLASSAGGVEPKNVALVFLLGLIPGGGVEVDYEKMGKKGLKQKLGTICAGTTINIILALLVLLATRPLTEVGKNYLDVQGMQVIGVDDNSPSYSVIEPGMIVKSINDIRITDIEDMKKIKEQITPNKVVFIETINGTYVLGADENGRLGIDTIPYYKIIETPFSKLLFWFMELLGWIFITSLGLGVANMMPLIPFDGGYLVYEILKNLKAERIVKYVYMATFLLVFINFFSPQIRAIFA